MAIKGITSPNTEGTMRHALNTRHSSKVTCLCQWLQEEGITEWRDHTDYEYWGLLWTRWLTVHSHSYLFSCTFSQLTKQPSYRTGVSGDWTYNTISCWGDIEAFNFSLGIHSLCRVSDAGLQEHAMQLQVKSSWFCLMYPAQQLLHPDGSQCTQ